MKNNANTLTNSKVLLINRRQWLQTALSAGALMIFSQPVFQLLTPPTKWDISHVTELTPGSALDLSTTLPKSISRGGTFSVDAGGAQLPEGVTLCPKGILSVSESFSGRLEGLIFSYEDRDVS